MKKEILVSFILASLSFGAFAQEAQPNHKQRPSNPTRGQRFNERFTAEERAEVYAKRMQKNINLTDEQYNRILEINLEQAKKQKELHAAHKAIMQASREKMKIQHQELNTKYESVLTPEQMKRFKTQQEKHKSKIHEGRKGKRR